jgi:hypothetical protein
MTNSTQSKSFILHKDSLSILDQLDDVQAGRLFKAIHQYHQAGEVGKVDQLTKIALNPFLNQFERDKQKYNAIVDRNKQNIAKRWNTKNTTGKSGIPNDTKNTDNKNKSDSDSKKDSKNNKDNENEEYLPLAEGLHFILETKMNKKINKSVLKVWSDEIRKLVSIDLKDRKDAKNDVSVKIQAISDHYGADYFPVIQSGKSLREKFTKIENFLERQKTAKQSTWGANFSID